MTIIVHDGSATANYNSYASLAAANTFHAARATVGWAGIDAVKEAALVRATDYIDSFYVLTDGPLLIGTVHPLVVTATIVMAAHALTDDLSARDTRDVVETEQELAGVGKKRVKYDTRTVSDPYPMVSRILAPLTGQAVGGLTTGTITK